VFPVSFREEREVETAITSTGGARAAQWPNGGGLRRVVRGRQAGQTRILFLAAPSRRRPATPQHAWFRQPARHRKRPAPKPAAPAPKPSTRTGGVSRPPAPAASASASRPLGSLRATLAGGPQLLERRLPHGVDVAVQIADALCQPGAGVARRRSRAGNGDAPTPASSPAPKLPIRTRGIRVRIPNGPAPIGNRPGARNRTAPAVTPCPTRSMNGRATRWRTPTSRSWSASRWPKRRPRRGGVAAERAPTVVDGEK
jgi:hypothetical protein